MTSFLCSNITRNDEDVFLVEKIAKNSIFSVPVNYDQIINALLDGTLQLEIDGKNGTKVLDDFKLTEIENTMPFLFKIVALPRSFILSTDAIVPIETAKKIGHSAIAELAKDSNNWHCRTILNIKPKNILAEINEETIDLYENRFVCSLIDKIADELAEAKRVYSNHKNDIDLDNTQNEIDNLYNTPNIYKRNSFANKLFCNEYNTYSIDYINKLMQEIERIKRLEAKISILQQSKMYKLLHRKKKVTDPILKTNIFMFDHRYKHAYMLWNVLRAEYKEGVIKLTHQYSEKDLEYAYSLYCFLCLVAVLKDMGYTEVTGLSISDFYNFSEDHIYENGVHTIKLNVSNGTINVCIVFSGNLTQTDKFILSPHYENMEKMTSTELSAKSESILCSLPGNGDFAFTSIDFSRCEYQHSFQDSLCRRFYGIGKNYAPEDATRWGSYKAGLVIVSPRRLKDSFLSIRKIINYNLLKHYDLHINLEKCPLCESKNIRKGKEQYTYICNDCGHFLGYTYCNCCDKEHKHPILWVKYRDENFLENISEYINGLKNKESFYRINYIETMMGDKATTGFELEKDSVTWKLKTQCPYCGRQLGKKDL